ncbi:MAG TPA: ABC-2 family transporter protein [Thermoanaerobaculia bacterium]|nr:ABC-2 family transporter protein [Thermoanaerobaculia bacterium]
MDSRSLSSAIEGLYRHLRLFGMYFSQYAKARLEYRVDFFSSVAASFLGTAASFGFLLIVFSRVPAVKGWKFEEMVFLYGFSLVPLGLFNVLSWNLYLFADRYLIEGRFDRVLLRPVSPIFQVLFESFRLESFQETATGLFAVAWAVRRLGLSFGFLEIVLFMLWAICGAVIYLAIFIGLTATSFWIEDRIGITPPVFNLMQFGRYPLTIYDGWVRFALSFVIPFAFASFYPTLRFLHRQEFPAQFWAVPIVAGLVLSIALSLWKAGVARYHSTGS